MNLLLSIILFSVLSSMTGLELATLVDSRLKPLDIKSTNTMKNLNGDKITKTYELITKSKDNSKKQMIWFLKPSSIKGTAFLKLEKDEQDDKLIMWLPGFKNEKRIKASEKSEAFMNSELSYEDLSNRELLDYEYKIVEENIEDVYQSAIVNFYDYQTDIPKKILCTNPLENNKLLEDMFNTKHKKKVKIICTEKQILK